MTSPVIKLMFICGIVLLCQLNLASLSAVYANDIHNKSGIPEIAANRTFIENLHSLKTGHRFSSGFIARYLGANPNVPMPGYIKRYFDGIVRESKDSVFIVVRVEQPEGDGKSIYSFTKSGEKVESWPIRSEGSACDSGMSTRAFSYDIINEIIEIRLQSVICYTSKLSHISVKYYQMADNGQLIILDNFTNTKSRKYPELSDLELSEEALKSFSSDELSLMRNEIFASHGLIFKASYWDRYFKSQEWYKPRSYDVSSEVSTIEKLNIALIKKFEKHN